MTLIDRRSPLGFRGLPLRKLFSPIEMDSRWGYIDETGKLVIEPQFSEVEPFRDGLARVKTGGISWTGR